MRWAFIRAVAAKELLSTLRDRRTLLSSVLVPLLLIPLFTVGFPLLLGRAFGGQETVRQTVGVQGELPPALSARLTAAGGGAAGGDVAGSGVAESGAGVQLIPVPDALAAVRAGRVDAALRVTAPLPRQAGGVSGQVQLVGRFGNLKTRAGVLSKLEDTLTAYNRSLVDASLRARGLDSDFLNPLRVTRLDATPRAEARSGQLAFLIPMFLMQFILAGGLATALDSTAGEKERGTLEVLLVSPVRRAEVVVGKLLATATSALGAALFSVLGLLLSAPLSLLLARGQGRSAAALSGGLGGGLTLSPSGALLIALLAVSVALLLSSLLVAVGIFARSLREAQTYAAPISLLIVLPAVGLQFADFLTRGPLLYSVPLIGGMLAVLDVVRGAPQPGLALLSVLSNLVVTALLALLALRSFGREGVIFR